MLHTEEYIDIKDTIIMLHTEEYIDIKDNICYILRNTLISRARDSYRGGDLGYPPKSISPTPKKSIQY